MAEALSKAVVSEFAPRVRFLPLTRKSRSQAGVAAVWTLLALWPCLSYGSIAVLKFGVGDSSKPPSLEIVAPMKGAMTRLVGTVQKGDVPSKLERYVSPVRGINFNEVCIHVLKKQFAFRFGDRRTSYFLPDIKGEGRLMPLWTHHRIFDHLVGIDSRKEFKTIDIRRSVPRRCIS
jgi:hypothetical protein